MKKIFNVSGDCKPELHYMVDISAQLDEIKAMVESGKYFTINRARQYGKTTTLRALEKLLKKDYIVLNLDFQLISNADFENEVTFVTTFSAEVLDALAEYENIPQIITEELEFFAGEKTENATLSRLFRCFQKWCGLSEKKIVLMIDEVDSASNNQIFLDFLSQLRGYYINRDRKPAFQSVILAGVYDIKNMKRKIRPEEDHKINSPWNIASDFLVDMSFSTDGIEGMLKEYEDDCNTGMDTLEIAELIYDYTSGYPFLVSWLCKLMDERVAESNGLPDKCAAWSREGFLQAVKILLTEPNTLFDSLFHKLEDYPDLDNILRKLLFDGKEIPYVLGDRSVEIALMFGFVKRSENLVIVSNRIFETLLYNYFLISPKTQQEKIYDEALKDKNQFVQNGRLNIRLVLEKFVTHFHDLYGDQRESFYEEEGRKYFLLYLRPIINGNGHYYIEAQTRDRNRTDVIVDYGREQFVIELKIWRGNAYHMRGEEQLTEYLDYYHLDKGYMLSFNFNKKKETGVKEIWINNKVIVEAVV